MERYKVIGLLSVLCCLSACTQLFFQPHHQLVDTPARLGVTYENEYFPAQDGTMLNAWFLPARGTVRGTILFLHGNAENISTHFRSVAWLPEQGYNVLALDYRGYGASDGLPTLAGVQQDMDAALRHLLAHQNVDPQRIVVFGQSLGGALAIFYSAHSAHREHIRAVISDSAFADYRSEAREALAHSALTWPLQWLPWLLIDNDYAPLDAVAQLSPIPLLLIHGEQDAVVASRHAQRLFDRAQLPKELLLVPDAGHIQAFARAGVREYLLDFLQRVLPPQEHETQPPR